MSKKAEKEKAAITAIVELDEKHKRLINCPASDPVDLAALAVQYMHIGMPKMGEMIMGEAWERENRKSVLPNGIIVNTETTSGYGGKSEKSAKVRPLDSDHPGCALSGAQLAA